MTDTPEKPQELTPREIVHELDRFIIGQDEAKRAVAIAVRNRWRRQQLPENLRDEVTPKNIIMIGPTGVGKTEIARRLASLMKAPFIKIEATKFTEVGYVGRDVDSIIRDLLERAIQLIHAENAENHRDKADAATEERIIDALLPDPLNEPLHSDSAIEESADRRARTRAKLLEQLRSGSLEDRPIEISVEEKGMPVNIFANMGMDQMEPDMQNLFDRIMPSRSTTRRVPIREARKVIHEQELEKLIDHDNMIRQAIQRTEQMGIVFLDEIDKVCGGELQGPDVSREGVQRDLLPLVEGTTVSTRHGMVRTDHILFIGAGAFSRNKPSDLMPELQGRFPIRVKLRDLDCDQFRRILTEPSNALTIQQKLLMETEGITLTFAEDGIEALAKKAYTINQSQQNIGARRLYAVMEKVCESISFDAPELEKRDIVIDTDYVEQHLRDATTDEDLNIFGFVRKGGND